MANTFGLEDVCSTLTSIPYAFPFSEIPPVGGAQFTQKNKLKDRTVLDGHCFYYFYKVSEMPIYWY